MHDAVIVDVVRTPSGKGKPGGALSQLHPVDLLAATLRELLGRNEIDPALVECVTGGCVTQACVPLAWRCELEVPEDKLNRHGGVIALGHPLGASGVRIASTLIETLERLDARFGLQAMCEAGGMANATIIERL